MIKFHSDVKRLLIQSLVLPLRQPQLFLHTPPIRHILLYGPPGTGKTMLARSVAAQLSVPFLSVACSSLMTPYFGQSEAKIAALFTAANRLSEQSNQPCVVFFDEIDAVTRRRTDQEDEVTRRVKSELLRCMDGVERNNVFIFGCTNCPWDIDEAFLRRFKRRILIDLPSPAQSFHLLLRQLTNSGLQLNQSQADQIVERLVNYSGSDVDSVARMVKHYPLDELILAKEFHINDDG